MERCLGCGIEAGRQPIVGIGQPSEELKEYQISEVNKNGFVAYGVCSKCHADPEHRRRTLKVAFFVRGQMNDALEHAGSSSINAGGR